LKAISHATWSFLDILLMNKDFLYTKKRVIIHTPLNETLFFGANLGCILDLNLKVIFVF